MNKSTLKIYIEHRYRRNNETMASFSGLRPSLSVEAMQKEALHIITQNNEILTKVLAYLADN